MQSLKACCCCNLLQTSTFALTVELMALRGAVQYDDESGKLRDVVCKAAGLPSSPDNAEAALQKLRTKDRGMLTQLLIKKGGFKEQVGVVGALLAPLTQPAPLTDTPRSPTPLLHFFYRSVVGLQVIAGELDALAARLDKVEQQQAVIAGEVVQVKSKVNQHNSRECLLPQLFIPPAVALNSMFPWLCSVADLGGVCHPANRIPPRNSIFFEGCVSGGAKHIFNIYLAVARMV